MSTSSTGPAEAGVNTGTCGWCDRPGREVRPCCTSGDHDTLVCTDSHDCMATIQTTLREQEAREAAWLAEQSAPPDRGHACPACERSAAGGQGHSAAEQARYHSTAEPAEVIAGRAILADFQHDCHEYATGNGSPDWLTWALRLSQHMQQLIGALGDRP